MRGRRCVVGWGDGWREESRRWRICDGTCRRCPRGSTRPARCWRASPWASMAQRCGSPRAAVHHNTSEHSETNKQRRARERTCRPATNSSHGTTLMLSSRFTRSIFSRISVVSPLTRSVKKLLAHPLPNAYNDTRLPLRAAGSTLARSEASPPYSDAVYMFPQRAAQRIEGATRAA